MDENLLSALSSINQMTGQLASASIAAASNWNLQKLVYQQQSELMDKSYEQNNAIMQMQRGWNLEDYYRILHDTSPAQSVKRYKEAGLSDAAAAQAAGDITPQMNSTATLGQSTPSAPAPDYSAFAGLKFDFLGAMRQLMAYRKEKVEAENMEATQQSDIGAVLDVNEAKQVALKAAYEDLRHSIEANPYSEQSARYHAIADSRLPQLQDLAIKQAKQNYESAVQQYGFLKVIQPLKLKEAQKEIDLLVSKIQHENQQTATERSQEALNYENVNVASETARKVRKETELTEGKIEGQRLQNESLAIDNVLKKYGLPQDGASKIAALVDSGVLPANRVGRFLELVADYVRTGQNVFKDDPDLQSIFVHQIAPGIGEGDKVPVWSHGSIYRPSRDVRSRNSVLDALDGLIFKRKK